MADKKTIAIDIDDVTADSTEALRIQINERFGINLTKEHYKVPGVHQYYYEQVWEMNGLSDKVKYADFEAEMVEDQSHIPLMEGADEAIHALTQKFNIIFITARQVSWDKATREWFKKMFSHDDIKLYFSDGYSNIGEKTKGQLCKEFGAKWLIDDTTGHCQSAVDEGVGAILFGDYGWHDKDRIPKEAIRCGNWEEVTEYLLREG